MVSAGVELKKGKRFHFDGVAIGRGRKKKFDLPAARLPTGSWLSWPITVVNGAFDGPTIWVSAAIHGDEINGVEIVRRVLSEISPSTLRGTLIAVPVVNIFGFIERSRYLPDRRDLNRSFPGSTRGSLASRMARLFLDRIVSRCSYGIDLHSATNDRTNLPQIRGNLDDPTIMKMAKAFGAPVALDSPLRGGSLRSVATRMGVPVLLYEAGQAHRFDENAINAGVRGVLQVMDYLNMGVDLEYPVSETKLVSRKSTWTRAQRGGVMRMDVKLGDRVKKGQTVALIADPFGARPSRVKANASGIVIGLTLSPLVTQGDGLMHIASDSR